MLNPLVRKLDHSGFLTDADRTILLSIATRSRQIERHQDLIREGDRPENVLLVLDGFAGRYKMMPGGRRQIMAVLLPGDFCDLHVAILGAMDHGISTLSDCTIVDIPRKTIEELTQHHHRIARALWWATLTDEAILRAWLANMGQREANKQTAHLFCELLVRLQAVGLASDDSYTLPITQGDLGDILGMSTVHINRTLQELRAEGLIELRSKRMKILNVNLIKSYCAFNPNYLHLTPRVSESSHADLS